MMYRICLKIIGTGSRNGHVCKSNEIDPMLVTVVVESWVQGVHYSLLSTFVSYMI